ncbi:MAG: hypothetical protein AB8G77_03380 [Rhodothermales bacterium]
MASEKYKMLHIWAWGARIGGSVMVLGFLSVIIITLVRDKDIVDVLPAALLILAGAGGFFVAATGGTEKIKELNAQR